MNSSTERRHHSRYPAQHIKVLVKSLRSESSEWKHASISSVDFNRYGIGLETNQNYVIGDIVSLIIQTVDSTITEVNGLVCNRSLTDHGFRMGIRFEHEGCEDEEADDAMINISEEILMIERQAAAFVH